MQDGTDFLTDLFDFRNPPCSLPWCNESYNDKLYVHCSAGHAIDEDCFGNYFASLVDERKTGLIVCPLDFCSGLISSTDLSLALNKDQSKLLSKINAELALGQDRIECPCGVISWIAPECLPLTKGQIVSCPACSGHFCCHCQARWDRDPQLAQCNRCTGEVAKAKKQIEKAILSAHNLKCPNCGLPWVKDLECTHMRCSNPKCNVEFCYVCSKTLEQLQQIDPTIERLFDHNQGYPDRKGSCPMYMEMLRDLYAPDTIVLKSRRKAALRAEERIFGRTSRRRQETALDIVPPMDPALALEWFHIQKAKEALRTVKHELGRPRWELVQQHYPQLLSTVDWAAELIPWTL